MITLIRSAWTVFLFAALLPAMASGMGMTLPLTPRSLVRVDVVGNWVGTLQTGGGGLRVVFHITRKDDGALTATLDSPDQGVTGIPVDVVIQKGDSLHIEVPSIRGTFEGKIKEDGSAIEGTWTQPGGSLPLVLERTEQTPGVNRPQEPEKPYPYAEEDVTFVNTEDDVTLAGTLTKPKEGGPFPAVILITGSGPQDRNETLLGHHPFLVLADYLTRRGIAVLRFDDRGIGQSTGNFGTATSEDFARDVQAGVAFLKNRSDVNPAQIGLVGHSEGGIIAPMVAVQSPDVAFIVLLAGTGLTGEQIIYRQAALIARANGASEEAIEQNHTLQERLFAVLKQEPDLEKAAPQLLAILREARDALSDEVKATMGLSGSEDDDTPLRAQVEQMNSPWFRYFLMHDPAATLHKVTCPVLAVNGTNDLQVPAEANLKAIEEALQAGGNEDVTTVRLEGLNHLFQHSDTGAPSEYGAIEETFAPDALKVIGDWILQHTEP